MSGKRPIFYSTILLTGVNLLLRLVSTSFQVYLSGRIGAAGIGLLQLVMSVSMLSTTASMAGIRTTAMYLTAEELGKKRPENVTHILSGCILYSVLCSGAVSIIVRLFAPMIAENWIGDLRALGAVRLLSAFLPIICLCGVMTGYFTAANRIGTLAAVEVAEQLCAMGTTMVLLMSWAGTDPGKACQSVVLGSGLGSCLTLICLVWLRAASRPKKGQRIPVAGRLLQAAVPLALADDLKSGISTAENLMVPKRLALFPGTSDPLADFGTVCGMVFPVLMFPACILFALSELLIPELARCAASGSKNRIHYLVRRSLRVAMLYGMAFGGLLFLLAQPLCNALYGSPQAAKYLQLYSVLAPMLYCDAVTDAMTKGLGQQRACVRYNIITSSLDVALLFVLLPRYGMGGYFASFLITHLINFLLSLRRLLKITGETIPLHIPLLAASAVICAVPAAGILSDPILRSAAFLGIFAALLTLFRVVSGEDLRWIQGLLAQKQPA